MSIDIENPGANAAALKGALILAAGVRTLLLANTTYYVATAGNDTTGDGSAGNPWATPQKAVSWIKGNIDFNGFTVTIQLADGIYQSANSVALGDWVGGGQLTLQGNLSDQTAVRLERTTNYAVLAFTGNCNNARARNLQLIGVNTSYGFTVEHYGQGYASIENVDVGGCYAAFAADSAEAILEIDGDIGILDDGRSGSLLYVQQGGKIYCYANTITNKQAGGAAVVYYQTLYLDTNGRIDFGTPTITGTFQGKRFGVYQLSHLSIGSAAFTVIPGDADGVVYDDSSSIANWVSQAPWTGSWRNEVAAPTVVGSTATFNLTLGRNQLYTVTGDITLAFAKWPITGYNLEFVLELVNGGAGTITWPTVKWIKPDGSIGSAFSDTGITLQAAASNFIRFWSRDNGSNVYGQVIHG